MGVTGGGGVSQPPGFLRGASCLSRLLQCLVGPLPRVHRLGKDRTDVPCRQKHAWWAVTSVP